MTEAESLAEALFSLEEPWRGRFLALLSAVILNKTGDERRPTQEVVVDWLNNYPTLRRDFDYMLDMWRRPAKWQPSI